MLSTTELTRKGRLVLGSNAYLGTFALDKVPVGAIKKRWKSPSLLHFIINTQTSNLPGQHWVAVSIDRQRRAAYIFDSFGQPPSKLLIKQLLGLDVDIQRIYYNTKQVQAPNTQNCGHLALQHLWRAANLRGGIRRLPYWTAFVH